MLFHRTMPASTNLWLHHRRMCLQRIPLIFRTQLVVKLVYVFQVNWFAFFTINISTFFGKLPTLLDYRNFSTPNCLNMFIINAFKAEKFKKLFFDGIVARKTNYLRACSQVQGQIKCFVWVRLFLSHAIDNSMCSDGIHMKQNRCTSSTDTLYLLSWHV